MITYISGEENNLQVPEKLHFVIYSLIEALRKAGASDQELQSIESICRTYLNEWDDQEKEIVTQVIVKKCCRPI
ncbi:MAG: hypothetical protein R2827_00585 [Bdellovibrionales bacterium]